MSNVASSDSFLDSGDRRIQRAVEYVDDRWFPVNDKLLQKIQSGLKDGRYELDIGFLIDDIKGDLSLLIYCIKELALMHRQEDADPRDICNPMDLLRWAGYRRISEILSRPSHQISTHRFEGANDNQRARITETIISAGAVEILSGETSVNPEFGFSSAILRNLGILLVAWNYPSVYSQILQKLTKNETMDQSLSEVLGFSPVVLALALLRKWGLPEWWVSSKETKSSLPNREMKSVLQIVDKLFDIGQALARANSPETYPTASEDWAFAKKGIVDGLGQFGIQKIQETVLERCSVYKASFPSLFGGLVDIDAERKLAQFSQRQLSTRNPFINKCSLELRSKLEEVYKMIDIGKISSEPIRALSKKVVPYAGFTGGYIYLCDPGFMSLVPRMQIENPQLRRPLAVPYSNDAGNSDLIALAFECNSPIIESVKAENGDEYTYIAASLGKDRRAGVLYLEIPQIIASESTTDVLTLFRAICQTLADCLHLS